MIRKHSNSGVSAFVCRVGVATIYCIIDRIAPNRANQNAAHLADARDQENTGPWYYIAGKISSK